MPGLAENSIVYQYRVIKKLQETPLWEDYLVEHLFLGCKHRLRIISSKLTNIPECSKIITRNIKEFAKLWHPYLLRIFLCGEFDTNFFYTFQHFEGESLQKQFLTEKIKSPEDFYKFHSKLLDIIIYLNQQNVSCKDLHLNDFVLENGEPLLINLNIFYQTPKYLMTPDFAGVGEFITNIGGIFIEREPLKLKDSLLAFARIMYQTIGWGTLEDALRIKQREQSAYTKKKEKHYAPLVPGIHIGIENIILRALADKNEGGYASLKELADDLHSLILKQEKETTITPFIECEIEPQSTEQEPSLEIKETPEPSEHSSFTPPEDLHLSDYSTRESTVPEISIHLPHPGKKRLNVRKIFVPLVITICLLSLLYFGIDIIRGVWGRRNLPPVAKATTPTNFVPVNSKVILDGSTSYDPNKDRLSYYWDVAKGDTEAVTFVPNRTIDASKTTAIFKKRGVFTIQLRVFDGTNFSPPAILVINVY